MLKQAGLESDEIAVAALHTTLEDQFKYLVLEKRPATAISYRTSGELLSFFEFQLSMIS